jgi:hypothetical protein
MMRRMRRSTLPLRTGIEKAVRRLHPNTQPAAGNLGMAMRVALGLMLLGIALPGTASADAHFYASVRHQVRVGIVVSQALDAGGTLGSENPDPHVFYVLDSRTDLKPAGMEFVNPMAPAVITPAIYQRWKNRPRPGFPDPAFVPGTPQYALFQVGNRVTKNMGAYWEVNVDTASDDDLRQFDLLFIHSHMPAIHFTPDVLAKLRRFMDEGGTLWVENCGNMGFSANDPFLFDIQMHSGNAPGAGAVIATPNHPLLSYPYVLSPQEVQQLGDKRVAGYYVYDITDPNGALHPNSVPGRETLAPIAWNTLGNPPQQGPGGFYLPAPSWRAMIIAGQVGAGRLVVSSQDSGCSINDYVGGVNVGYGGNSAAISGDNFLAARPMDLEFVYNMATWATSHMTELANVRRTSGSSEVVAPVLSDKWAWPTQNGGTAKSGGVTYYKNCVFYVDGDLVLHCFDARPEEDLDGDQNPDEGLPDFIAGQPYDEVWRLPLKSVDANAQAASTPTVFEFYDADYTNRHGATTGDLANFNQRELVVVTLSDGTVVAVRAFPRLATAGVPLAPHTNVEWVVQFGADYPMSFDARAAADDTGNPTWMTPVPSVAFSDGVVFAGINTANGGRVVAIDPREGMSALRPGPLGSGGDTADRCAVPDVPVGMPAILSAPTVGYQRDEATGCEDKMVYVAVPRPQNGPMLPETVRGFWFATKGEPLRFLRDDNNASPARTYYVSRADKPWFLFDPNAPGNDNQALRQRVFHRYTDPVTGQSLIEELRYIPLSNINTLDTNSYSVDVTKVPVQVILSTQVNRPGGGTAARDPNLDSYYADYTLDWDPQVQNQAKVNARTVLVAPDPQQTGAHIGGAPALSGDNLLFYNVSTVPPAGLTTAAGAGVVFGAEEQFLRTTLKWTYVMHNGFTLTVNGQATTIPPRLRFIDTDPRWAAYAGQSLSDVQFVGSPAYANGIVYSVAHARIQGAAFATFAVSVLCAFKANPEVTLRLNTSIDPGTPVRIRQLNPVLSQNLPGVGGTSSNASPVYVELNPAQYTVNYSSGLVRITSMAPPGQVANFVSGSLPFLVTIGNGPEQMVAGTFNDPDGTVRITGPPGADNLLWYYVIPAMDVLPGANFGLGLASSSPKVEGDTVWIGFEHGFIVSLDADPGATDPSIQSNGGQVRLFPNGSLPGHLRWIRQVSSNTSTHVLDAPSATSQLLAAGTSDGIQVLEDTRTVIADGNRLLEVNAAGEAVWTCDGTRSFAVAGGELPQYMVDQNGNVIPINPSTATGVPVVQTVPFARPSVVRYVGRNNLIVVDTGNNRVVMMDRGGNVLWEVNRLQDDFKHVLRPGDPLNLNEPTDVQYWTEYNPAIHIAVSLGGQTYSYNGPGYIVHYLISDTGNYRVIELIDVYDQAGRVVQPSSNGNPAPFVMYRQVNFVSSSYGLNGERLRYRSVQRITMRNGDLPVSWQFDPANPTQALPPTAIRFLTLSLVTNQRLVGVATPGGVNSQVNAAGAVANSSGGSLVVMNEAGNPLAIVSNLRVPDATAPNGYRIQPIVNPTSFSMFTDVDPTTGQLVTHYLLTDQNGCYQMVPDANDPTLMDVEWLLSGDDYYAMTGKPLLASSIQRLSTETNVVPSYAAQHRLHHFLITNRFTGSDNPSVFGVPYNTSGNPANGNISGPTDFHGEVFELDPRAFDPTAPLHGYIPDYGVTGGVFLAPLSGASIVWRCPVETLPIPGAQVGVIRRTIGDTSRSTSTSLLEQPACAQRSF